MPHQYQSAALADSVGLFYFYYYYFFIKTSEEVASGNN